MSSIQPKKGQCIDCESGLDKYLTADRCQFHYWKHRKTIKDAEAKRKGINIDKQAQKKALDLWYAAQISKMPARCENCPEPLIMFAPWAARAYIAHIVEKRNFKSVMTHPLNRVYLCIQCHSNYDNWSEVKVQQMPVIKTCMERFVQFVGDIAGEEMRFLPGWLGKKNVMKVLYHPED